MSSSHSPDDEDTLDSAQAMSGEAVTPRGGFMARPGLKTPPRHAVVVRVGDAPVSEHIPLARSSFPPPPPPSVPPPPSASEKITLRAIPTPSTPPAAPLVQSLRAVVESAPPPSDAAVVASVRESVSGAPASRRGQGSRWTIIAAAAAGLLFGFASVAVRMHVAGVAAQSQAVEELPQRASVSGRSAPAPALASASAQPNAPAAPANERVSADPKAPRPAGAKRSIF